MCEKPLVPTATEAKELFALAESTGKILSVYQNRRWDSDFLTVKEIIASGKVRLFPVFSVVWCQEMLNFCLYPFVARITG